MKSPRRSNIVFIFSKTKKRKVFEFCSNKGWYTPYIPEQEMKPTTQLLAKSQTVGIHCGETKSNSLRSKHLPCALFVLQHLCEFTASVVLFLKVRLSEFFKHFQVIMLMTFTHFHVSYYIRVRLYSCHNKNFRNRTKRPELRWIKRT